MRVIGIIAAVCGGIFAGFVILGMIVGPPDPVAEAAKIERDCLALSPHPIKPDDAALCRFGGEQHLQKRIRELHPEWRPYVRP